ncbi:anaerobic glycerol-3-phosphate dehydrogenase subunit GlpA [Telmatospirillum siberiense]|uniref:Anaerobic glycerol-3-phosphate dehydrogenase subunit A n=1 Tax=Telmatospirillum siberiense TaxID=382514 RepID=A0A2N3PU27_9PROT|nr:anaerobic glycerol-3-phosphate dehydrogenase subunit GlpA [Telmatospirillum siberiense]PKU23886.1 anaerobic glycerol-3-phosphate dehydrogenase subunit A [Telmatospirillum siberiense]
MESTQVIIVGGGATGAGILWDLSLRGIPAVLLEKKDLANGATGRCHGLLHSGGRYVVKDPEAARECAVESAIIKKIAPHCVHDTGGLFVRYPQDDPTFFDRWESACRGAGIASEEVSADDALGLEPNLPKNILGAYTCPDAHVDVFQLTRSNIAAAVARGAGFRAYCEVTAINIEDGRVRSVDYRDSRTGEEGRIACEVVINAGGGWAQKVAAMAGVDVPVRCDKGSLLVLNHNLVTRVVNRCRMPGDADILVPAGPVCILGTSSMTVPGPEGLTAAAEEVQHLLDLGIELIPTMAEARVLRIFSGARPLYTPKNAGGAGGREISRGYALLDHAALDQVEGFVSIVGGKMTTYRLMAEVTCDLIASKLGVDRSCETSEEPLRLPVDPRIAVKARQILPAQAAAIAERRLGPDLVHIVNAIDERPELAEIICECEQVTRAEVEFVLGDQASVPVHTISDIGRRTRLGFGPCQGTFCGYKAMLSGYRSRRWSAAQASDEFERFLDERWKGQSFVPQGKQVEQLYLSHDLFGVTYNFHDRKEG